MLSSCLCQMRIRNWTLTIIVVYIYTGTTQHYILELQSRLPRRKASYSLPKNCTSNRAQLPRLNFYSSLLHTKTCIIMYFLHPAFVFNVSKRMGLFIHVFFPEIKQFSLYRAVGIFFLMVSSEFCWIYKRGNLLETEEVVDDGYVSAMVLCCM